jgi:hypothetical protein
LSRLLTANANSQLLTANNYTVAAALSESVAGMSSFTAGPIVVVNVMLRT